MSIALLVMYMWAHAQANVGTRLYQAWDAPMIAPDPHAAKEVQCYGIREGVSPGMMPCPIMSEPDLDNSVSMIEITSYSTINGKLWACPVGSQMISEIKGKPNGGNTTWVTYCKVQQ